MTRSFRAGPRRPGTATDDRALLVVLGGLTAIAPLTIDMYIPSFPAMAASFRVGDAAIQLTMTAFLVGVVLGQLFIGPFSDRWGRRTPLLAGGSAYALASVLCALAPTVGVLVGARFLQGVAGAAGMVIARAVVTDRLDGVAVARGFAALAMILAVAPVVGPIAGGLIAAVGSWRLVFVALAVLGLLLLMATVRWVPESLPIDRRRSDGVGGAFAAMAGLLAQRVFLGLVLTLSLVFGSLFAYVAAASFVFQVHFRVTPLTFGLLFAANAVGVLVASWLFGRLVRRVRVNTLLTAAVLLGLSASAVHLVVALTIGGSLVASSVCLFLGLMGASLVISATTTLAQTVGRHAAGAASAVLGGAQFVLGAAVSPLAGSFGTSPVPMAAIMTAGFTLGLVALLTLCRPWQGHGEPVDGERSRPTGPVPPRSEGREATRATRAPRCRPGKPDDVRAPRLR